MSASRSFHSRIYPNMAYDGCNNLAGYLLDLQSEDMQLFENQHIKISL
jgi:hypothetical protein